MSAAIWDLQAIELVARQISGQLDVVQLTNDALDFNINSYYQYDLPRRLKIEELYKQWTFMIYKNQSTYNLPGDYSSGLPYTHVEPKLYVNGLPIFYTQDTNQFYQRIPRLFATELVGYGDGVTKSFVYTTINSPIVTNQVASVLVTDNIENFEDDGQGNLIGSLGGTGTVNYITGQLAFTFNTAPPANTAINTTYHFEQVSLPNTVLFCNRQFTFYPCPNTTYQVRIDAYQQPAPLVNPTDVPVKPEWGEIIAIGAARKIVRNFGQIEKLAELNVYYEEELLKLKSDTDNQLMFVRAPANC